MTWVSLILRLVQELAQSSRISLTGREKIGIKGNPGITMAWNDRDDTIIRNFHDRNSILSPTLLFKMKEILGRGFPLPNLSNSGANLSTLAAAKSMFAIFDWTVSYTSRSHTWPRSILDLRWLARLTSRERVWPQKIYKNKKLMAMPLMCSLPRSHQDCKKVNNSLGNGHEAQKSLTVERKSSSIEIQVLSFHLPGPRGRGSRMGVRATIQQNRPKKDKEKARKTQHGAARDKGNQSYQCQMQESHQTSAMKKQRVRDEIFSRCPQHNNHWRGTTK